MSSHDSLNSKETTNASREAAKGAIYGAGKYGLACLILAGIGQAISPVYRGLTIQFKV